MKFIDNILKKLKTDRNTFFTYVFTLISIYLIIDRLFEFILILFTGIASSYWSPLQYAVAYLVIYLNFAFSCKSKYIKSDEDKLGWFYSYCIELYIFTITLCIEAVNKLIWLGILSLPNYNIIITEYAYLIKPAVAAIALWFPLSTWHWLFKKLYLDINTSKRKRDGLFDYDGINLAEPNPATGAYSNEIFIGIDKDKGNNIKIPENRRLESTIVSGVAGTGKTSLIFEPWIAQDISKKYFFRENAKILAFGALQAGIASLNAPYNNDYININFNLNMIKPIEGKEDAFRAYFKKLLMKNSGYKMIYKGLGLTYVASDIDTIDKVKKFCDNYQIKCNIIDPLELNENGLNPFALDDIEQTITVISTIIKEIYIDKNQTFENVYRENTSRRIIENIVTVLKAVHIKLNDGKLPNLNDMFKLLNDFTAVEKMCKILENDKELSKKYENQINYFKNNFYENSINFQDTKRVASVLTAQLDSLLRYKGIKEIICNRNNNLNLSKALEDGEITLVCTRRGELGETAHKSFGLFFLMLLQSAILKRPGNTDTRLPHFLYIDEFYKFICQETETMFTLYRKYKIGMIISIQNRAQLYEFKKNLGNTILSNCTNKIVFGNMTPEDNQWWAEVIGQRKEWVIETPAYNFDKHSYDTKVKAEFKDKTVISANKLQSLKFKKCAYNIRNAEGKQVNGVANLDFVSSKHTTKHSMKTYNFTNYNDYQGIISDENKKDGTIEKNINPIKMDKTNLNFDDINNGNAIIYNLKKKK